MAKSNFNILPQAEPRSGRRIVYLFLAVVVIGVALVIFAPDLFKP